MGEAQNGPAGVREGVRLGAVALERPARLVRVPAVQLDDESLAVPDGVSLVALHVRVRRGAWQVVGIEEGEEAVLQRRAGERGAVVRQLGQCRAQLRHAPAAPATHAPERFLDALDVERSLPLGFAERFGQCLVPDHLGEIHERPADGGDRDPLDRLDVLAVEAPPTVDADPLAASALGRRADVDPDPAAVPQAMERRGVAVAQRRSGPDREDGGKPVAVRAQVRMPDGVDAAVELQELATCDPLLDHRLSEPGIEELGS